MTMEHSNKRKRFTFMPVPTKRLNIDIHITTAHALRELSEANGVTQTEIVRRAIAILKLLEEESARGMEIQLVDPADTSKIRVLKLI